MVAFVIDRFYLVITLLITIGWQCAGFFIAWTFQVGLVGPTRIERRRVADSIVFGQFTV